MTPRELGLPYDSWYPFQWENARAIAHAKEPITFCEVPTGGGKSLMAMAAAKLLGKPRTVILCTTKQLQQQYLRDFQGLAEIIFGRGNFRCAVDQDFTCDEAPCSIEGLGCSEEEKWQVCPYYRAKRRAVKAPIVITNTKYFLYETNYVGAFSGVDFLIVDEGDLLERELLSFASIELSKKSFSLCDEELPAVSSVYDARRWARRLLPKFTQRAMQAEADARADMSFLKRALRMRTNLKKLKQLSAVDPSKWVLQKTLFGYSIQPLWADSFAKNYVLRHADKVLIMSATLPPPEIYARLLGIDEPFQYIEAPCLFPLENRPINFWPVARLKGQELSEFQINRLVNAIDLILERFPREKGVVHTVSYKLRDAILRHSRYPSRFISHNDGQDSLGREEALKRFLNTKEPRVLLSPSMERGVDLRDDSARFNIVSKFPFPSMGDPQVKARMKLDPDWYAAATADALVQSCGRSVRHKDDYSVTFILDGQEWFFRRYKRFFPVWFRDAVVKIKTLEEARLPPMMR